MQVKVCSGCSAEMLCGSGESDCWCMKYASLLTLDTDKDCLCQVCLTQALAAESVALEQTEEPDYYIENGLYVFTKSYHLKRGWCCKNGCRHCPYKS